MHNYMQTHLKILIKCITVYENKIYPNWDILNRGKKFKQNKFIEEIEKCGKELYVQKHN